MEKIHSNGLQRAVHILEMKQIHSNFSERIGAGNCKRIVPLPYTTVTIHNCRALCSRFSRCKPPAYTHVPRFSVATVKGMGEALAHLQMQGYVVLKVAMGCRAILIPPPHPFVV